MSGAIPLLRMSGAIPLLRMSGAIPLFFIYIYIYIYLHGMEGESLTCTLCNDTFIRSECIASNISIRIWAEVAVA